MDVLRENKIHLAEVEMENLESHLSQIQQDSHQTKDHLLEKSKELDSMQYGLLEGQVRLIWACCKRMQDNLRILE